jgi:hypothetical protein
VRGGRFDAGGGLFAAADGAGLVGVWSIRSAGGDERPRDIVKAFGRRAYDLCFLDQGAWARHPVPSGL